MNQIKTSTIVELKKFIDDKTFKKIFIIAGNQSYNLSGLKKFFLTIKNKNIKFFFKVRPYPEYSELMQITKNIELFSPDLIIAAGGGSVMDYAKIANVINPNSSLVENIKNSSCKLKKENRKLLAIPTTAGSGAEVTSNAVIYINGIKYSIEGELIKPDYFFLIPDFIIGASSKIKASAGFDAIAQAIESLMSRKSNGDSVEFAKKSLNLSLKHFISFVMKPNQENTCAMSLAANLSGKAISISKTTAPHAVSYPFTALFNISHGHAVSLTLSKFMIFNFKKISYSNVDFDLNNRFNILFDLTKTKNIEDFNSFLINTTKEANLETNFKKLGIDINSSISKILTDINDQRLSNNPVIVDKEIVKKILLDSSESI
jgi:alcohol dehydrogenase class IV